MLEQFRISDFLEWHNSKVLILNPDFQRGSVWSPPARIMLIDTILRDLPIPKVFIRSKIDRVSKKTMREVVDGQQRLRAIIDFANDKITLSKRAKEFAGRKFSTLDVEFQDKFLEYPLAVDQLINATDEKILDIFARLNSYNVKLNAPELRHAAYQGEFRSSVHESSVKLFNFWNENSIFSYREMVRMENDALTSEMYGILLQGVSDGGSEKIDKLYKKYDADDSINKFELEQKFGDVMNFIDAHFFPRLADSVVSKPPHLLMLFAAAAHVLFGIPRGQIDDFPPAAPLCSDMNVVADRLVELGRIITSSVEPESMKEFWRASRSSTQRISSRKIRFPVYYDCLTKPA